MVGGALGDSGSGAWTLKAAPWLDGSGVLFRLGAGTGLGLHSIQKERINVSFWETAHPPLNQR